MSKGRPIFDYFRRCSNTLESFSENLLTYWQNQMENIKNQCNFKYFPFDLANMTTFDYFLSVLLRQNRRTISWYQQLYFKIWLIFEDSVNLFDKIVFFFKFLRRIWSLDNVCSLNTLSHLNFINIVRIYQSTGCFYISYRKYKNYNFLIFGKT